MLAEKVRLIVGPIVPAATGGCQTVAEPVNAVLSVSGAAGTIGPNHPTTFNTASEHTTLAYGALVQGW